MSIARGPVNRPILTFIIFLIIIILGVVSFTRLPIDLMPEITYPTISVSASYGNVGPQEIEEQITRPIEEAIAAVQGVEEITGTSSEGRSQVRISFAWGTELDVAANDIRDRIDRIMNRLPEGVERPSIRKFDLSAFPVLIMGVSGNMSPMDLRKLVEDQVKYRLERLPGVASVDIRGGLNREIHITVESKQLKAFSLSADEVISSLYNENKNIPVGLYTKGNHDVLIRTQGEFTSLDEIRNTVIATRNNIPIMIGDVAKVTDASEEITQLIRIDGEPGLRISISKQSGANTVSVAESIHEELKKITKDFPQIQLIPLIDTSKYIKQSISNMGYSVLIGGFLAILVLFLFLRNITSTAIIATAIPVSIIATFGLLYFSGLTLNIMTFGGLALGIGMLVDSSIVVLENIYRHKEQGKSNIQSALDGTSEVWSAILASVLTTIVVFLPVVFVRGVSGIMFQQMAIVVSFSLLCSLVVSLTLIPMLSSKFLKLKPLDKSLSKTRLDKIYAVSEKSLRKVENKYGNILKWALNNRKIVLGVSFVLFLFSVVLVKYIGIELMPETDEGEVRVTIEMAVGTKLEVMDKVTLEIEEKVKKAVPEIKSMLSRVGGGGWRGSGGHSSQLRITLHERNKRKRSSREIADDLRKILQNIPGVSIRTRAAGGLFLLRMGSDHDDEVSIEVRGYDLKTANELAVKVDDIIKTVPGITDTRISREEGNPEQIIRVDRQKAADLGLSISLIGETLQTAISGSYVSYFRDGGKQYRILVRLKEEDRKNLDDILDLTIINNRNEPVILRNVVNTVSKEGPVRLERKDQERVIHISANFTERDMGSVISDIREKLREVPVPKDFSILFGGDYEEQQRSFKELLFGLVLAIILVYLVMTGQFESFKDPFVILFSIPMALVGIVVTMILTETIFSMQAFIGCIMLAGIVVNNAILLVDYTNRLRRKEGLNLFDAVILSGSRRLRPILMTTLTTVLGLLPLSFGFGEGGEAQAPLARVAIGGLLSSTLITLILIPVIYSIFEQKLSKISDKSL
ncbi:MAG: efflux RND transporter permease subunit [Armatimonadetes bacterium]|nr:efflux RND transporter permease subunit [Armatimonadota bacterium]